MSRKSRASITSTFIHVMVQGINKEYIFKENQYKKKYLNLLFSNIKKYDIQIISNCVMDNHSHCIFHFSKIEDVSNLMHIINTSYAQWYNNINSRVGYVFRDRYKIEPIQDLHHLYSCIRYVHNNPVKAGIVEKPIDYKFSSYRDYTYHNGIYNNKLIEILQMNETDINDIILNFKEDDDNNISLVNRKIEEFIAKMDLDISNKKDKKEVVLFLKKSEKLNNTQISKIMNMDRKTIYRILNNK